MQAALQEATPEAEAATDDRGLRERLFVGFSAAMLLLSALLTAWYTLGQPVPWIALPCAVGSAVYLVALLWHLRTRRFEGATFLVVGYMLAAILGIAEAKHLYELLWSPWWGSLPIVVAYFVHVRAGAAAAAACLAGSGLVVALGPSAAGPDWVRLLGNQAGYVILWTVAAVHLHGRALLADKLRRTLGRLDQSRGQLSTLLDHTSSLICSVDRDLRVIEINAPLQRLYDELWGMRVRPGQPFLSCVDVAPRRKAVWQDRLQRALSGTVVQVTERLQGPHRFRDMDITITPIRSGQEVLGATLYALDVTERLALDQRLREANRQLLDLSRRAGMAEMATGFLHDVRNVLNSINIAASEIEHGFASLRVDRLEVVVEALYQGQLVEATKLAGYLHALSDHLRAERVRLLEATRGLARDVDLVKTIVTAQERHAGGAGVAEVFAPHEVVQDALQVHQSALVRDRVQVVRQYDPVPDLELDRHRVLHILLQLLANARRAVEGVEAPRIEVAVRPDPAGVALVVRDNGVGIAPADLPRIFEHGFTSWEGGHGFGLHASANLAAELRGSLQATSEGPGRGAVFTLILPEGTGGQ